MAKWLNELVRSTFVFQTSVDKLRPQLQRSCFRIRELVRRSPKDEVGTRVYKKNAKAERPKPRRHVTT